MKRWAACICILTLAASCDVVRRAEPTATPVQQADVAAVFLTGNELGELKPCGCSGGQLGGFDRRAAILNSVPSQRRFVVDTGSFVTGETEQDLIKFNMVIRAFDLLDYDLVNLTERDIEIARNLGLLNSIGSLFNIISARQVADANVPTKFAKQLPLRSENVAVTVAAFDAKSSPIEQIDRLFADSTAGQSVNILILTGCDSGVIDTIAKSAPAVDCLVCPADSDEPRIISEPNRKPLAFSVGRFGRYVCRLNITKSAEGKLKLDFQSLPVQEKLQQEPALVGLYRDYQQLVKEHNLVQKYPRFSLPEGLKFVGSDACKSCHPYEDQQWRATAHAHAYATLEKVGSQFDPECVLCHVVGMEYESGFISQEQTAHLKDVGCENCHGPGSEHVKTLGKTKTAGPKSSCLNCHTPEKSTEYAGNEQAYLKKIIHWQEPKAAGNVK